MQSFETHLLTYALNSLWQVPLIFAAAWLAARLLRRSGPATEHRVWATALLLEALLPACSLQPLPALQTLQHWLSLRGQTSPHPGAQVTVSMGPAHAATGLQLPPALLTAAALLYLSTVLYFAARLCVGLYRTASLRHRAEPLRLTGYASQSYQRYARLFAVNNAAVATSSEIATPMTLGIRHRLLLLPAQLTTQLPADLPDEDLDAIFAHEFAHMRRRDFAKNLAYEALSLPASFHPLLWLTRTHLAQTRELLCDAVAAESVAGSHRYARSLLRLASKFSELPHPTTPHAIGIFDANHAQNFERRIMNLTHKPIQLKGPRRLATTALSLLLGACACTSALALRMQVAAPAPAPAPAPATQIQTVTPTPAPPAQFFLAVPHSTTDAPAKSFTVDIADASTPSPTVKILSPGKVDAQTPPDPSLQVSSSVMAGNRESFVVPTYPPEAKAAGIQGAVLLRAIIGKDGKISRLQLISGPAELTKSALDAVKKWTYKPYLFNGNPVAVDTTITVTYSLQK